MIEPEGNKENPARSCKDMTHCKHRLTDGFYWIDPNQGSPQDSIRVFCNFTMGGSTCFNAKEKFDSIFHMPYSDRDSWFSEKLNGFKIVYDMDHVQLKFLRMLSTKLTQKFVLKTGGMYAEKINFRSVSASGRGRNEIDPTFVKEITRNCAKQECLSEIVVEASDPDQLPISDFSPRLSKGDTNYTDRYLSFEVGMVCFS